MNVEVFSFGNKNMFYYDVKFDTFTVRRLCDHKIEFLASDSNNRITISPKFKVTHEVSANSYKALHENILPEKYVNKAETKILFIEFIKILDSIFKNKFLFERFAKYDEENEGLLDKQDEANSENKIEIQKVIDANNRDFNSCMYPFMNRNLKDYIFMSKDSKSLVFKKEEMARLKNSIK